MCDSREDKEIVLLQHFKSSQEKIIRYVVTLDQNSDLQRFPYCGLDYTGVLAVTKCIQAQ